MKKKHLFIGLLLLFCTINVFAQDDQKNGNALNITFRKYGLSFGNSLEFTGIRFNTADKGIKRINGLNFTFMSNDNLESRVNGISLGFRPQSGILNGFNFGLFGLECEKNMNGINFSTVYMYSEKYGNINGLSFSGLVMFAGPLEDGSTSKISGIAISGIWLMAQNKINGLIIGGLLAGCNNVINGIGISGLALGCENTYTGIAITPGYFFAGELRGLSIAGWSNTKKMKGISIALSNDTDELHGIQIGLLNYAANNPKLLRTLPFINMHFGKK